MSNTFVADPAVASTGSMLVNQIEVDQKPLPMGDSTLMQVSLSNGENDHETAIITTKLEATQVDTLNGKTVAFTYGPRLNLGTFYGYVKTVVASKVYQEDGVYDIECFGVTSPLQQGKPRFFSKKTGPQMVADVVRSHNLGVQVDEHTFVFPTHAQTDDTDWGFVASVARHLGWVLYNYNGVVRMVDPLRILTQTGPILRLIRGAEVLDHHRQLLDFNPQSTDVATAALIEPVFGFFDGDKVGLSKPLDKSHRLYTDSPTLNRSMAAANQKAWASNPDTWTQQADGRVQGNPSLIPGTVVDIQSSGSSVIQHDYDGLWLVRAVHHVLTAKSFQTQIKLGRPAEQPTGNVDYRPFWAASSSGRPQVVRKGDVWESSWKAVSTISSKLTPATPTTFNTTWTTS